MNRFRGHLHHFFYWRVEPNDASDALDAVRQWQRELMKQQPSLAARLYVRHEAERVTVMETYAAAEEAVLSRLHREGDAHTAPWRRGERHRESFSDAG